MWIVVSTFALRQETSYIHFFSVKLFSRLGFLFCFEFILFSIFMVHFFFFLFALSGLTLSMLVMTFVVC